MWEATGVGSRELMDFVKEEEGRIKKKSYWQMRCILTLGYIFCNMVVWRTAGDQLLIPRFILTISSTV